MGPQLYRCGNLTVRYSGLSDEGLLQWGRNFIVAETKLSQSREEELYRASMGPQLYRCGNAQLARRHPDTHGASMGPQLYRCGNRLELWHALFAVKWLQWGRNFIVAETSLAGSLLLRRLGCFNGAATLSLRKHCKLASV